MSATRWTGEESRQIEGDGEAAGWGVDYLRPIARFPELAGDLANVAFTKAGGRKHSKH